MEKYSGIKVFGRSISDDPVCKGLSGDLARAAGCSETKTVETTVTSVVNTILYVGGILAVVMIIVAGIQMITSAGNSGAVAKAKQTLIYSVVGLIVMVLAWAIVNFVISKL